MSPESPLDPPLDPPPDPVIGAGLVSVTGGGMFGAGLVVPGLVSGVADVWSAPFPGVWLSGVLGLLGELPVGSPGELLAGPAGVSVGTGGGV
jgi:hypothetical protein